MKEDNNGQTSSNYLITFEKLKVGAWNGGLTDGIPLPSYGTSEIQASFLWIPRSISQKPPSVRKFLESMGSVRCEQICTTSVSH